MERNGKRVEIGGGGALIDDLVARTQLLTDRICRERSNRASQRTYREADELPGTKSIVFEHEFSPWTRSDAKRAIDVGIVLMFSPILFPVVAAIALAVLVTSGTPILFRQERAGRNGVPFLIHKFRTMRPALVRPSSAIAIASASRVTWLGALLRKSKLDELPQIFNVLAGEMSLVGPRPKVPEQEPQPLPCRPGLTGAATLAFAREEIILQGIASTELEEYFQKTILSWKRDLDADYLRRATLWSDLWILINTVIGRWEGYALNALPLEQKENELGTSGQTAYLSQ
jgi:lipopolysaccharide/colanic/teichoic acid biosynthesis glycosyltransferase